MYKINKGVFYLKIFNCILGIFSFFAAFYCFGHPLGWFFANVGWVVAAILCVIGICSIFEYARKKENKEYIVTGVMGLVFGIAAVVISMCILFNFKAQIFTDVTILVLFAIWLVYIGIEAIGKAIKAKKEKAKSWWWTLILGILSIIGGFFSGTHLIQTAIGLSFGISIFFGTAFTVYGVRLIGSLFEKDE